MTKSDPLSDLRIKVLKLLENPGDAQHFVKWLVTYAKRAEELIAPKLASGNLEAQLRDLLADLSRFQSDQLCVDWAHKNKLILKDGVFYWWLNPENRVATIHGLEQTIRGIPRITNGIDVWLELPDGRPFLGHRDFLKYERRGAPLELKAAKSKKAEKPRVSAYLCTAESIIKNGTIQRFLDKYSALLGGPPQLPDVVTAEVLAIHIEHYMNKSLEITEA